MVLANHKNVLFLMGGISSISEPLIRHQSRPAWSKDHYSLTI